MQKVAQRVPLADFEPALKARLEKLWGAPPNLYRALANDEDPALPGAGVGYRDLAEAQRRHFADPSVVAEVTEWWRRYLAELSGPLELPTDHPRPRSQDRPGFR